MKLGDKFVTGAALVTDSGEYRYELGEYDTKVHAKPHIARLVHTEDYEKLVDKIQKSNVDVKEKAFLILTSARLMKFDYTAIARYYAFANPTMQALMRESALVVLDKDTANALGFVKGVIREK